MVEKNSSGMAYLNRVILCTYPTKSAKERNKTMERNKTDDFGKIVHQPSNIILWCKSLRTTSE